MIIGYAVSDDYNINYNSNHSFVSSIDLIAFLCSSIKL